MRISDLNKENQRNKELVGHTSTCIRVLFVCMGNICRSPTAEAVFKHYVAAAELQDRIFSDSAGTHDYHVGESPDERARNAAERRGYDLSRLRGRQVRAKDFAEFDYVLAMDEDNLELLQRRCPPEHAHKLLLLMNYSTKGQARNIPDPYYGGPQAFELVLDMVEDAAQGLVHHLDQKLATWT
jgi:protein-tyrosine phosphatase